MEQRLKLKEEEMEAFKKSQAEEIDALKKLRSKDIRELEARIAEEEELYTQLLRSTEKEKKAFKVIYDELKISYEKLVEIIAKKPTTTNNTTNNILIQNLTPLTDKHLQDQAQFLTIEHLQNQENGLATYITDHALKDRAICTDASRKKVMFKGEDGEGIVDYGMKTLMPRILESVTPHTKKLIMKSYDHVLEKQRQIRANEGYGTWEKDFLCDYEDKQFMKQKDIASRIYNPSPNEEKNSVITKRVCEQFKTKA